jgi:predicted O-methyltransferase YrrM
MLSQMLREIMEYELMSKFTPLTESLYQYLWSSIDREPELLRQLRHETSALPLARMQIAPDQGQFMALLAQMTAARKVLEIGTFTGYSSLALALVMPAEGRVVCCDLSGEWTDIARRYWNQAGVADKIELHLQPALQTLEELLREGAEGSFDMAFIDADKENYRNYYEACLKLLRPGGLILIDNVLWGGSVIDEEINDIDTIAIRELNAALTNDLRITLSMLPVGDGLTLALKR